MGVLQPVPGYSWRPPGTPFGPTHPFVDIPAPNGTPVVAVADGRVLEAGWELALYQGGGNTIRLEHVTSSTAGGRESAYYAGKKAETSYSHLSRIIVKKGQMVRAGQTIGYVGSTGRSTGPHLHFGLKIGGVPRDYQTLPATLHLGAAGMVADPSQAGPLQQAYTGEKLIPLKEGQSCPPGYQPAAVDPRLAGVIGLNLLTGWAGTKPFDQLKPGEANACVLVGAFQQGDNANAVGVAGEYGLLGQGLAAAGDLFRNGIILLALLAVVILGAWVLVKGS